MKKLHSILLIFLLLHLILSVDVQNAENANEPEIKVEQEEDPQLEVY